MTGATQSLFDEALVLPPVERRALIEALPASFDPNRRRSVDSQWAEESEERLDAYDQGERSSCIRKYYDVFCGQHIYVSPSLRDTDMSGFSIIWSAPSVRRFGWIEEGGLENPAKAPNRRRTPYQRQSLLPL